MPDFNEVRPDGKRTQEIETIYRDENDDGLFDASEIKTTTTDWTYDEAGRLIDEVFSHYDDLLTQSAHFSYDLTGNRLEQQVEKDFDGDGDIDKKSTTYNYDANDRLLSEQTELDDNNDGTIEQTNSTTYTYTGTQQTGKTVNELGTAQSTTAFTYDLQGRMETVTITTLDGTGAATRIEKTTYDYNATGIRVSALHEIDTDANGTFDETTKTEYLNDPKNFAGYSQVIQETVYDENDVITKRVIYSVGHDQISQTTIEYVNGVAQTPETLFFGQDGLGSTRVLFDMVGAIASAEGIEQLFFYDAYGNLLNMEASQAATSFLYRGEQFDARINQQYLRARYYDAASGRFNRLDPFIGLTDDPQTLHKYLYVHGDPVNYVDRNGKFEGLVGAIGSIAISGTVSAISAGAVSYIYARTVRGYSHAQAWDQSTEVAKIAFLLAVPGVNLVVGIKLIYDLGRAIYNNQLTAKDYGELVLLAIVLRQVNTKVTPRIQNAVLKRTTPTIGAVTVAEAESIIAAIVKAELKSFESMGKNNPKNPVVEAIAVDLATGEVFIARSGNNIFAPLKWDPRINRYTTRPIPGGNSRTSAPLGNCAEPRMVNSLLQNGNQIGPNIMMKVFGVKGTPNHPTGCNAAPCTNCSPLIKNTGITVVQ